MDREKIKQFILDSRNAGVPDSDIASFLQSKGAIPKTVSQFRGDANKRFQPIQEQPIFGKGSKTEGVVGGLLGKALGGIEKTVRPIGQGLAQGVTAKENTENVSNTIQLMSDTQLNLVKAINRAKEEGRDTIRLENALAELNADIEALGGQAEDIATGGITNRDVVESALKTSAIVAGSGSVGNVGRGLSTAQNVSQGVIQGAKTGAIEGGVVGALTGAGESVGSGEGKITADEITGGALKGGALGAAGGAVVGGIIGGFTGAVKQLNQPKQIKAVKNITPDAKELTPTEYKKLLRQGRITPRTATESPQYVMTDREAKTIARYEDLFQSKDPVKNSIKTYEKVGELDKKVGNFLSKNNGIYNDGELRNAIAQSMEDIDDLAISQDRIDAAKNKIIDGFMDSLDKNDMKTLWQKRKLFDKQIESAFRGSPSLSKEIKKGLRNAVQEFIAERTQNNTYKTLMGEMSDLLNIEELISKKAVKQRSLSALQSWAKKNDTLLKVVGGAGGVAVLDRVLGK